MKSKAIESGKAEFLHSKSGETPEKALIIPFTVLIFWFNYLAEDPKKTWKLPQFSNEHTHQFLKRKKSRYNEPELTSGHANRLLWKDFYLLLLTELYIFASGRNKNSS